MADPADTEAPRGRQPPALVEQLLGRGLFLPHLRDRPFEILELVAGPQAPTVAWQAHFPRASVTRADLATRTAWRDGVAEPAAGLPVRPFLLALAARCSPLVVWDATATAGRLRGLALALLYPVLRPGGAYVLEQVTRRPVRAEAEAVGDPLAALGHLAALLRAATGGDPVADPGGARAFLKATAESALFRRHAIMLRKRRDLGAQRLPATLPIRALEEAAPATCAFDNGGAYHRIVPRLFDVPPALDERMRPHLTRPLVEPPPACAALLQNCVILGNGVVVTERGTVIRESLINQQAAQRFAGLYRPGLDAPFAVAEAPIRPRALPGAAPHVLLKQRWDSNYGHWLVESLPRLAMVRAMADLAACRFLVRTPVSEGMRQVFLDSLALFGIAAAQVDFVDDEPLFVRRLIYPAPLTVQPWVKAPSAIRTLEALAASALGTEAPTGAARIYVSRNDYQARRRLLLNEAELLPILAARGYEVVRPEALSLREQIAAFAGAGRVVGNLGGALSNLVFAPQGVRLFALTTEFMQDDFFYDIVCHKGGAYWSLHGRAETPGRGMQSDFTIDPARFAALLDEFEA